MEIATVFLAKVFFERNGLLANLPAVSSNNSTSDLDKSDVRSRSFNFVLTGKW